MHVTLTYFENTAEEKGLFNFVHQGFNVQGSPETQTRKLEKYTRGNSVLGRYVKGVSTHIANVSRKTGGKQLITYVG